MSTKEGEMLIGARMSIGSRLTFTAVLVGLNLKEGDVD